MNTGWQSQFLNEHELDVMQADIAKMMSLAEKDLTSFVKSERAVKEAEEKTKRLAEKALHKAFDILAPKLHEADRSAILALAAQEMKAAPEAYATVMRQLKDFIAESETFHSGPAVLSTYLRTKDSKGEPTNKTPMAANRPFQGIGSAGGEKTIKKYTKQVIEMGYTSKRLFVQAKNELGVGEKGFAKAEDLRNWIAKHKA